MSTPMTPTPTTPTTPTARPAPAPAASAAPISGIPFGRLVRVEWRKATDTRAARWLLGITALGTLALMLVPLLNHKNIDQNYSTYLTFAGFALATLVPVTAVLTLTSEWTQRTVMTTFTQEPRRIRVIGAKVVVSLLLSLATIVYGAVVTAAAIATSAGAGYDPVNDLGPAKIAGFAAFIVLNVGIGVAFGALLHNSAAAIVGLFALPTLVGFIGAAASVVSRWLDTSTTFNYVLDGDWDGHVPNVAVSVLVWILLPLAAGVVRTVRREVN